MPLLRLTPELTIYTSADLQRDLLRELPPKGAVFDVEAGEVAQIDAAGVQLLLSLQRLAGERGSVVRLLRPSDVLKGTLRMLNVDSRFELATHAPMANQAFAS